MEGYMEVSVFQKPKAGNACCGDSYYYKEQDSEFVCVLADGLGSGRLAKESSQAVIEVVERCYHHSINTIVEKCNEALTDKRGVVLGLLKVDYEDSTYAFTSVGNVGIVVMGPNGKRRKHIPTAGYLSGNNRKCNVVKESLTEEDKIFMFSDGVNERHLLNNVDENDTISSVVKRYAHRGESDIQDDATLIGMKYYRA
ncbi:SpoIIE family protein phosphatase [Salirhabdus salicampi]|uniref:SpoIIE family protein phosphatase n=1 Tax=Salirhabdus salicampi TaxID=476102 RepID=UPI0020C3626D|nr:SpoIIE family protein phosphatase [Salirhabdus salicampi]MCP8618082.1 SpoIIE family protein phosphatase [Salirhabdus salicampi]